MALSAISYSWSSLPPGNTADLSTQVLPKGVERSVSDPSFWLNLPVGIAGVTLSQWGQHFSQTFTRNSLLIRNLRMARGPSLSLGQRGFLFLFGTVTFYGLQKIYNHLVQGEKCGTFSENLENLSYLGMMFAATSRLMGALSLISKSKPFLLLAEYAIFTLWESAEGVSRVATRQLIRNSWNSEKILSALSHPFGGTAMIERGAFILGMKAGNRLFEPIQKDLTDRLSLQQFRAALRAESGLAWVGLAAGVVACPIALPILMAAGGSRSTIGRRGKETRTEPARSGEPVRRSKSTAPQDGWPSLEYFEVGRSLFHRYRNHFKEGLTFEQQYRGRRGFERFQRDFASLLFTAVMKEIWDWKLEGPSYRDLLRELQIKYRDETRRHRIARRYFKRVCWRMLRLDFHWDYRTMGFGVERFLDELTLLSGEGGPRARAERSRGNLLRSLQRVILRLQTYRLVLELTHETKSDLEVKLHQQLADLLVSYLGYSVRHLSSPEPYLREIGNQRSERIWNAFGSIAIELFPARQDLPPCKEANRLADFLLNHLMENDPSLKQKLADRLPTEERLPTLIDLYRIFFGSDRNRVIGRLMQISIELAITQSERELSIQRENLNVEGAHDPLRRGGLEVMAVGLVTADFARRCDRHLSRQPGWTAADQSFSESLFAKLNPMSEHVDTLERRFGPPRTELDRVILRSLFHQDGLHVVHDVLDPIEAVQRRFLEKAGQPLSKRARTLANEASNLFYMLEQFVRRHLGLTERAIH